MTRPSETLIQEYRQQAERMLPPGLLWIPADDTVLRSLLTAVATEFARVDQRAQDALAESDPRVTLELLADWERFLGLPDPCAQLEPTNSLRRLAVVAKLSKQGGASKQFFVDLALALGFVITIGNIEEHKTFRAGPQTCPATTGGANDCGSHAGDKLAGGSVSLTAPSYLWAWTVHAPEYTGVFFDAESGAAGEPLVAIGNDLLECHFEQAKPAHTVVIFAYDQSWEGYAPWTTITPGPAICTAAAPGIHVDVPT